MSFTFFILVFTLILNIYLIIYVRKKSKNNLAKLMIALFVLLSLHIFVLIIMKLLQNSSIPLIYIDNFTYLSTVNLPVVFFLLATEYRKPGQKLKKYIPLFIIPIITLISLWTNDLHHLFYKNYSYGNIFLVFGQYYKCSKSKNNVCELY